MKAKNMSEKKKTVICTFLMLAGLALIAAGIYRSEVAVVFNKASKICMECIGIG